MNELESRLEHVNQTSKEEIERLEESLKQTKIQVWNCCLLFVILNSVQGEATQQLLVVRYEAEIDDLERRVKAATEEVQEVGVH